MELFPKSILDSLKPKLTKCNINILNGLLQICFGCADYPTTRSLARYGVGLRNLSRLLCLKIGWSRISVLVVKEYIIKSDNSVILVFDETVERKSRKKLWLSDNFLY